MAPTPDGNQPVPQPTNTPQPSKSWSTGGIIVGAVCLFLLLALIATVVIFLINKRRARSKLPPEHRRSSYHPFRTESSDKKGLLEHQAPTPEDDKSSMFSRDRSRSSVSLFVPSEELDRRPSLEKINLIPLHITPVEETADPIQASSSSGSGVSAGSRVSLAVSPLQMGTSYTERPASRPRSTSTTSMRYYSTNSPADMDAPQVPKIAHRPSQ